MITADDIAAEIAAEGQEVALHRVATNVAPVVATCMAMVRGYKPAELVGGILQGDTRIVVAAVTLADLGWPVPPRKNDKVLIAGRVTTAQAVETVYARAEPAKYIIHARG